MVSVAVNSDPDKTASLDTEEQSDIRLHCLPELIRYNSC